MKPIKRPRGKSHLWLTTDDMLIFYVREWYQEPVYRSLYSGSANKTFTPRPAEGDRRTVWSFCVLIRGLEYMSHYPWKDAK